MDPETVSLLLHGCKLARELELNLPNLANQPGSVSVSCEQIVLAFSAVRDQIAIAPDRRQYHMQIDAADFTYTSVLLLRHRQQQLLQDYYSSMAAESSGAPRLPETSCRPGGGGGAEADVPAVGRQFRVLESSDRGSGRASSSSSSAQRSWRRWEIDTHNFNPKTFHRLQWSTSTVFRVLIIN